MTNARYCINVLDKNRIFDIHLNQTLFRLKKNEQKDYTN